MSKRVGDTINDKVVGVGESSYIVVKELINRVGKMKRGKLVNGGGAKMDRG